VTTDAGVGVQLAKKRVSLALVFDVLDTFEEESSLKLIASDSLFLLVPSGK
jgi:hypothetical protein